MEGVVLCLDLTLSIKLCSDRHLRLPGGRRLPLLLNTWSLAAASFAGCNRKYVLKVTLKRKCLIQVARLLSARLTRHPGVLTRWCRNAGRPTASHGGSRLPAHALDAPVPTVCVRWI